MSIYNVCHIRYLLDIGDTLIRVARVGTDKMSTAQLTQERTDAETIEQLPTELDSDGSKLVYLYLNVVGEATVTEMQSTLNKKQLALYPVLDTLESRDLIEQDGETYTFAN